MKRPGYPFAVCQLFLCITLVRATPPMSVQSEDGRLSFRDGVTTIGVYDYSGTEISRPFFANLQLADGRRVTRNHPPVAGQDDLDHGTPGNYFHPGAWLAFSDLNGNDYWRLKAKVCHESFLVAPEVSGIGVTFAVRNTYRDRSQPERAVAEERCRYQLERRRDGYVLVCDSVLRPTSQRLEFGDQEEMGLGIRVARPLAVKHGGQMTNSRSQSQERQIWGKEAMWCECVGRVEGKKVGVMLLADTRNPTTRWHARDYGFLAANSFGAKVFGAADERRTTIAIGETLRLRYAICWRAIEDDSSTASDIATELQRQLDELPRPEF